RALTREETMIRTGAVSRSVEFRRARATALRVAVAGGIIGMLAWGGRAVAFQAVDGTKSAAAPEAGPAEKPKPTPPRGRELTQALRQLHAAVQAEHSGNGGTVPVNVQRPNRTVTPPTITSAELDRLVQQYLVKSDPKVEAAPMTTDVEFVRRVYFDLIGK